MAAFLLDGRMCPALFLDGNPRRAVYWYKSTEGDKPVEARVSNSLVFIPEDNGDSWTASDYPTGAAMVLIVPDDDRLADAVYMQSLNNRLVAAHANQQRAYSAAQAGNTAGTGGSVEEAPPPVESNQPLWQQLGFASKADWKAAGSPQS